MRTSTAHLVMCALRRVCTQPFHITDHTPCQPYRSSTPHPASTQKRASHSMYWQHASTAFIAQHRHQSTTSSHSTTHMPRSRSADTLCLTLHAALSTPHSARLHTSHACHAAPLISRRMPHAARLARRAAYGALALARPPALLARAPLRRLLARCPLLARRPFSSSRQSLTFQKRLFVCLNAFYAVSPANPRSL